MTNIFLLLKYDILMLINRFIKNKKQLILFSIIIPLIIIQLGFTLFYQNKIAIDNLLNTNYEYIVLTNPILMYISFMMLFIISNSVLTTEKNTDFLLSLPIKKKDIISSKSITTIIFHLLVGLLMSVPTYIYYYIKVENFNILLLLITLINISLILSSLGYVFNTFINHFIIKLKFYKILRTIIVLLTVFTFLFVYIRISIDPIDVILITDLVNIILNNNYFYITLITLSSIISIMLSTLLFSKYYGIKPNYNKSKNNEINNESNSQLTSLIKKEFRNYFNSTMYLFNTIIGYLILLGGSIALLFIDIPNLNTIVYLVVCLGLSLCCTTNSSISLEGKNIWIIKTAPINIKTILLSKIFMNLIMLIITLTISFTILIISNKIEFVTLLLLFILSLSISILITFSGLIINLYLPKLEFKNEMEVVKQSASAISSILSFMLILSIPPFLYLFELFNISLNNLIIINIIYVLVLDIFIVNFTFKKGKKLFIKL